MFKVLAQDRFGSAAARLRAAQRTARAGRLGVEEEDLPEESNRGDPNPGVGGPTIEAAVMGREERADAVYKKALRYRDLSGMCCGHVWDICCRHVS